METGGDKAIACQSFENSNNNSIHEVVMTLSPKNLLEPQPEKKELAIQEEDWTPVKECSPRSLMDEHVCKTRVINLREQPLYTDFGEHEHKPIMARTNVVRAASAVPHNYKKLAMFQFLPLEMLDH